MTPALSVRHLAKSYGPKQAVVDVSFDVERGEVFALLGPSGARAARALPPATREAVTS